MKIKSIYISAFGGLKDFSLDFSDGFQVIFGENEAGKTTVCEFIKAMFYGSRKSAGMDMSAREKYAPFDGSPAGGRITFSKDNKDFVLERQFRKSDATDKVTLLDLSTGVSSPAPSDIGKDLFGIGLSAFERSVFIANSPEFSFDADAQGEINQKLADTALAADDGVSYKKVLDRIDAARLKLVSKSGRTGTLSNDIAECNRLIETLKEADRAAHKKQEMTALLRETEEKLKKVSAELEGQQALLDSAKDIENIQKIKEYLELKKQLDTLTRELTLPDGTVADEMFLKKFEFAFSKLRNIKAKAESTAEELARLNAAAANRAGASPEELQAKIEEETAKVAENEQKAQAAKKEIAEKEKELAEIKDELETSKGAKKPFNAAILIIGAVLLLSGAGLYIPLRSVFICGGICAAGVILLILSFVLRPKNTALITKLQSSLEFKSAAYENLKAQLAAINGETGNISAKIENLNIALNFGVSGRERINETAARLETERGQETQEKAKILAFFSLPHDTDLEKLQEKVNSLSDKAEEQKQIKLRLSYLSRDLGGISYEQAEEKLKNSAKDIAFDANEVKETVKALSDKKSNLLTLKAQIETELKTAFRGMRDPQDLRRDIAALKEQIAEKQAFYDAANIAYSVLEESFIAARQSFGSVLESETLKNFKALTRDGYGALNISKDFDILAERKGSFGMQSAAHFSRGTKDQAYLALRLAVSHLISENEPLPVFLDDALSQYDDKRFLAALKFLSYFGETSQICLFTCHDFVKSAAQENNIKVLNM